MGLWTGLLDYLIAQTRAAMVTDGRLSFVKTLMVGDADKVTSDLLPYLWLYYDAPPITETWVGANRKKAAVHHFMLEGATDYPQPEENEGGTQNDGIYGTGLEDGTRGALSMAERVMDVVHGWDLHRSQLGLAVDKWDASLGGLNAEMGKGVSGFVIRLDITQKYGDRDRSGG